MKGTPIKLDYCMDSCGESLLHKAKEEGEEVVANFRPIQRPQNKFWRVKVWLPFACRPEDIKGKLDKINLILYLSLRRGEGELKWRQFVAVPKRADLSQLTVRLVTEHGGYKLVIKAPWLAKQEAKLQWQQQQHQRLAIDKKLFDCVGLADYPYPGCFSPCCVKVLTTGEWLLTFDVNIYGFHQRDLKVFFNRAKSCLVVTAKRKGVTQAERKFCPPTRLYWEFFLPASRLDIDKMTYNVTAYTGLVTVTIPCLNNRPVLVSSQPMKCIYE